MGTVTIVHDCDVDRRGDGSTHPYTAEGDFRDTMLDSGMADTNYGGENNARVGLLLVDKMPFGYYGLVRFDLLSFLPADAVIQSAVWHFYNSAGEPDPDHTYAIAMIKAAKEDWVEMEATWNEWKSGFGWTNSNAKDDTESTPTPIALSSDLTTGGWKSETVTAFVTEAWDNRSGICTWLVYRTSDETETGYWQFVCKDIWSANRVLPHHLRVTYTLDGKTFQAFVFDSGIEGQLFYQSCDGVLTSGGLLGVSVSITIEGTLSSSGGILRSTFISPKGVLTFAGSLVRAATKSITGTFSSVGSLHTVKIAVKAVSGILTLSGILVNIPRKSITGVLSPSGILIRKTSEVLIGVLTLAGTLSRILRKLLSLSGTLTTVGTLTNLPRKLTTGILTLSGTLIHTTFHSVAGTLASSGSLSKTGAISVPLAGALNFTGNLRCTLPVLIAISLTLYSGVLTNVQKGATLSLTALSGMRDLIIMVLSYSLRKLSGTTSISKADHPILLDLILYSGQQDLKKETKDDS